jgi:cytoskeletal protein CcmA (bactofilin family)
MKYGESLFGKRELRPLLREGVPTPPIHAHPAANQPAHPVVVSKPPPLAGELPRGEEHAGAKLIVGPNIKLKGVEIDDCDTLVVEGVVEATMDSRVIQIAENGSFSGKVVIDVAEIRGVFNGELTARLRLVVHATGRVKGKIRYGKLLVQEGGELTGDVAAANENGMPAA